MKLEWQCVHLCQATLKLAQSCKRTANVLLTYNKTKVTAVASLEILQHLTTSRIADQLVNFWHPQYTEYVPDHFQDLINCSLVHYLTIPQISRKSIHNFLSQLSCSQTNKQTVGKTVPPARRSVMAYTSLCNITWHKQTCQPAKF